MLFYDWTYIIIFPALILSLLAQALVSGTFSKYSKVLSRRGITARQLAQALLHSEGVDDVAVERVGGKLTDHYDPKAMVLRLSDSTADSASVAALGVAAHECGHVLQHRDGYAPLMLRTAAVPIVNFGSTAATPLFVLGLVFSWQPLVYVGIALFSLSVIFALITLPVEFDASRRAVRMLTEGGYVTEEERSGVKAVLNAAALTYVASAVTSLLSLLRLLIIARRNDDR